MLSTSEMQLHELTKSPGLKGNKVIKGRGNSSRKGNYCGKGLKGQKSRSGGSIPAWFEGGQTPLHMRLPKLRGFKRYFKLLKDVTPVDVVALSNDERVKDGQEITVEVLTSLGYVKKTTKTVKILGNGNVAKKLSFTGITLFSKAAVAAIEKAGGSTGLAAE